MATRQDLEALPRTRKLILGAGVLLLLVSFLPWYHASFGPLSVSLTGWHQVGTLAWVVLIVTLAWEAARIGGVVPTDGAREDRSSALGALAVTVLGAVFVIQRLSDGHLGIGLLPGVVLLVVLGYAGYGLLTETRRSIAA